MKIISKSEKDGALHLEVKASTADVENAFDAALRTLAMSLGVMPGNADYMKAAITEKLGLQDVDSAILKDAEAMLVPHAIGLLNINPAFLPAIEADSPMKRGEDFDFKLTVVRKPDYELTSYDPVYLKVPKFEIDDSQVDAEIERVTGRFRDYVTIESDPDHAIEKGDFVKLAMKAYENGVELKGFTTEGRTYAVGAGEMPSSFDEGIIGMKVGETKNFTFSGPSIDENGNPCEQNIDAEVTILEMQEERMPELNDEWVRANMPMYRGYEDMRADMRQQLEHSSRASYDAYLLQIAAEMLTDRFEGSIADEVYEQMRDQLMNSILMDLRQQGKDWATFVEENGGEHQMNMMLMMQVRQLIVQGYVLDAVFRHFGLELTDEDYDRACMQMNPQANPKMLRQQIEASGQGYVLRELAERTKANQYVLDNAVIEYV